MFEDICTLITNVGFPIAVSCYLLYRDSTTITTLSDAVAANTTAVSNLITKFETIVGGE